MSFDWESYLSLTNSYGADPQSFTHIEQSLRLVFLKLNENRLFLERKKDFFAAI